MTLTGVRGVFVFCLRTARRTVLNSGECGDYRLFVVHFDPQTGSLTLDKRFHDAGSENPGVSMDGKSLAARIPGRCVSVRDSVFTSCVCGITVT